MFDLKGGRERIGAMVFGGLLLLGAGFVGAQRLKQPGPVVIQSVDSPPVSTPASAEPVKPGTPSTATDEVVVDVSGAVKKSGVMRLAPGSRVDDAIRQAVAKPDADLESLNLAAKLEDGTVLYVPHKDATQNNQAIGEAYIGGVAAPVLYSVNGSKPSLVPPHSSGPKQPAGKVSLNTGSLAQLETLPGVGPSTAQKILDYRQEHGGFGSVDELLAVKGIGEKKLEKLRPWLKL